MTCWNSWGHHHAKNLLNYFPFAIKSKAMSSASALTDSMSGFTPWTGAFSSAPILQNNLKGFIILKPELGSFMEIMLPDDIVIPLVSSPTIVPILLYRTNTSCNLFNSRKIIVLYLANVGKTPYLCS